MPVKKSELVKAKVKQIKLSRKARKFNEKYIDNEGYLKPLDSIKNFSGDQYQKDVKRSGIIPQARTNNKGRD